MSRGLLSGTPTPELLDAIFQKARPGGILTLGRVDCDGREIRRTEYGQFTDYGWQIDHIHPSSLGGTDDFANLRPRHWRGNASHGGLLGALLSQGIGSLRK